MSTHSKTHKLDSLLGVENAVAIFPGKMAPLHPYMCKVREILWLFPTTSLDASARIIWYSQCMVASDDIRSGSIKTMARRLRFSHRCKSTQMRYWDVDFMECSMRCFSLCVSVVGVEDKHQKGLIIDWWFTQYHDHDDDDSWFDEDYMYQWQYYLLSLSVYHYQWLL